MGNNEALDTATDIEVEVATVAVIAASSIVPAGFQITTVLGNGKGGPGTMIDGASAWLDAGQNLNDARDQLQSLLSGLSSDQWSGEARDGFTQKMSDFGNQLGDSAAFELVVGAVLGGLSAPLLAYGPFCDGVAAFMVAEAAFVVAASASTLGLGLPAAEAEANIAAETCFATVDAYNLALIGVLTGAAAGIEIDAAIDVRMQMDDGSTTAKRDWEKGQIDGAGEAAVNAFNWASSKAIDKAGEKFTDGILGERGPLDSVLRNVARHEIEKVFTDNAEDVRDAGEQIGKDLIGGDPGGSNGGGSAGGGGGGGGGSWPSDPPWDNPGPFGSRPGLPDGGIVPGGGIAGGVTGVGEAIGGGVSDGVGDAIGGGVSDGVGDAIGGGVSDGVGDAIGNGVSGSVGEAIGGDAIGSSEDASSVGELEDRISNSDQINGR